MVFIDESGINSKLGERKWGYAPKGQVIPHKVTGQRAKNFSLLPAMTVDGYIACNLYRGSVDENRFINFIQHDVLPLCTPFPGPRSVIVMDNASIHRGEVCLDCLI
jgi:DDE superfamily endonuclease